MVVNALLLESIPSRTMPFNVAHVYPGLTCLRGETILAIQGLCADVPRTFSEAAKRVTLWRRIQPVLCVGAPLPKPRLACPARLARQHIMLVPLWWFWRVVSRVIH